MVSSSFRSSSVVIRTASVLSRNCNLHDSPSNLQFGAIVVWSPLTRLVGGDLKAKSLWKYHRMGGYLSIVFLFVTPLLAIKSDWVVGHSSLAQRAAMGLGLGATIFGLIARIKYVDCPLKI